jgi:cyanophycin synthetase
MLLVDARRLTGPNLLSRLPLVVVELSLDPPDVLAHVREVYLAELGRMRAALGYPPDVNAIVRRHRGGAVIAYDAPLDVMLPLTEMSEWAALSTCEILASRAPLPLEPKRAEIEAMLARDRSPEMLELAAEAKLRDLPFLWDDSEVSVGTGAGSDMASWPRTALPKVADVPWDTLKRIPIALVTGTNGKTTSSRLLARIVREAGFKVGFSSSDAIVVGTTVVDQGDYTGPAAARAILRHKDVDFAVLETARGGILRRGLAMDDCDAALITNVSEDHTGGYGIDDLAAMTHVKAVPVKAVRPGGTIVLNAHDPKLVSLATTLDLKAGAADRNLVFFADLDRGTDDTSARDVITRHRRAGGSVVIAENGAIVSMKGDAKTKIADVASIPLTFGGAARYNVENVLGAVAMAQALSIPQDAIARGLAGFDASENPGRGEIVESRGVRVMLDFGHNPQGLRAVMTLAESLRRNNGRLYVVAGSAGDRTNHEVNEMCRTIAAAKPRRVYVRELRGYMRGRLPGEMSAIFRRSLSEFGVADDDIVMADSEVDALRRVLDEATPDDFVLVLVHLDREPVLALFRERG